MSERVLIIGAGLAGLAAASALAPRGFQVTLLESRPRLGGRASSFTDAATGQLVDACQHVSMGCCTNFAHFCRSVGIDHLLAPLPCLYFMTADRRVSPFFADRLPAPLHLARSFLRAHYLSFSEKMWIAWGLLCLRRQRADKDVPFLPWLRAHGQTPRMIERFWGVVLVSALNEEPDRIGLRYARKVFVDGFMHHRRGFEVSLPTVPLGRLYGSELQAWFDRHGVEVGLGQGVRRLCVEGAPHPKAPPHPPSPMPPHPPSPMPPHPPSPPLPQGERGELDRAKGGYEGREAASANPQATSPSPLVASSLAGSRSQPQCNRVHSKGEEQDLLTPPSPLVGEGGWGGEGALGWGGEGAKGNRIVAVELRSGERQTADWYISTVPFDRLLELLPEEIAADPFFANLHQLELSPITSVHLWYDRPVLTLPHAVLIGCLGQWVFSRGEVVPGEHYLQVVVSAARGFRGLGHDEVQRRIVAELAMLFPQSRTARLLRARVVTEHAATFSAVPGVDRWRPSQASPIRNLLVAGDWTATHWPATMEGAIRSGYLAAEALLQRCGRPEKLLQPDL